MEHRILAVLLPAMGKASQTIGQDIVIKFRSEEDAFEAQSTVRALEQLAGMNYQSWLNKADLKIRAIPEPEEGV